MKICIQVIEDLKVHVVWMWYSALSNQRIFDCLVEALQKKEILELNRYKPSFL